MVPRIWWLFKVSWWFWTYWMEKCFTWFISWQSFLPTNSLLAFVPFGWWNSWCKTVLLKQHKGTSVSMLALILLGVELHFQDLKFSWFLSPLSNLVKLCKRMCSTCTNVVNRIYSHFIQPSFGQIKVLMHEITRYVHLGTAKHILSRNTWNNLMHIKKKHEIRSHWVTLHFFNNLNKEIKTLILFA